MSNAAEENKITELPESEPAHRIAWPRRSVVDDLDSGDNPVLQVDVVDVPFDGQPPMRVLQWKNTTDLKRVLEEIRPQPAGTARVFGYASYSDRKRSKAEGEEKGRHTLENHLSSTYGLPYYGPPGRTRAEPGSDIRDIALQWTQSRSDCDMMRTDIAKLSLKTYLVSRHERFKVTSAESSTLRCWKDGDDKLIAFAISEMPIEMREWASDNLTIPERCIRNGLTTFGNHTMERFTKLLVLEYLTSSFYLLPPYLLLNVARATDRIEVSIMFDLPDSLSKHENEYLLYLERCETILHGLSALAEAIDFMVEILAQQTPEGFDSPKLVQENEAILIVQRLCHQRLNNVRRSIERLNRAFEGRNKALNIQESLSVKRLTVLAAIFIPLSLSSSLLSMQTRFVHLHLLLYDFIGMFVILSTFALLLFFLITQALRLKRSNLWWTLSLSSLWADRERSKVEKSDIPAEAQRDKKRNFYYWLTKLLSTCLLIFYLLIWSVVLVSFIVGMTFKVVLGLKILGYGFAGLLIYVILVFVLLVSVITATGGNIVEKCYYWEATVPSASW